MSRAPPPTRRQPALLLVLLLPLSAARADPAPDRANPACAAEVLRPSLLARAEADQQARRALVADPGSRVASDAALRTDAENTAYMRELVARCGWPRRSEIGEEAARAAWLLTQHADMAPDYQVLAAQRMYHAVLAGEADATRLALLTDRHRRLAHLPQVYGMQYVVTDDRRIVFHDIVTPGQLESRRKEIGLGPFFCWAMQVSAQHGGTAIDWPPGVLVQPDECPPAR